MPIHTGSPLIPIAASRIGRHHMGVQWGDPLELPNHPGSLWKGGEGPYMGEDWGTTSHSGRPWGDRHPMGGGRQNPSKQFHSPAETPLRAPHSPTQATLGGRGIPLYGGQ